MNNPPLLAGQWLWKIHEGAFTHALVCYSDGISVRCYLFFNKQPLGTADLRQDRLDKDFVLCAPPDWAYQGKSEVYLVCKGIRPAHPDGNPYGIPGDEATKQARISAHDAFDKLWKDGHMTRRKAYQWLSERLGIAEAHISEMGTDECDNVIRIVEIELRKAREECTNT